ncbi:MAG: hypothetical protein JNL38_31410 [Myxococcales bacterium]|jgi:hypothetical protein|nr:hypothetical protein [Myxococcales bacterium]
MKTKLIGAALAVGLGLIACSSDPQASPDEACASFADSLCNKFKGCFPELFPSAYTDVANCVARQKIGCKNTVTAKGTGITSTDITTCGSGLSNASCDKIYNSDNTPLDGCRPKTGTLEAGTACQDDSQCKSSFCKFGTSSCGACGTRAAAGSKCDSTNDCEFGLVCGATSTCVKPGAAGDSCSNDKPCGGKLVCKTGTAGSTTGTCAAPGGAGDACNGADCDGSKALFCSAESRQCQAAKFANPGEACGFVSGTYTGCSGPGAVCATTGTGNGTCKAGAKDGEACDTTKGPFCQTPARCVNSVCTLPTACGG